MLFEKFGTTLERARDGDQDAFVRLVTPYDRGFRVRASQALVGRLGRRADPGDIVQNTWQVAWQCFDQFRGSSEAEWKAWLSRVFDTQLAQFVRKAAPSVSQEEAPRAGEVSSTGGWEDRLPVDQTSPSQRAARAEEATRLAGAIEQLPESERRVLIERYHHHQVVEDIAGGVGRTQSAVRGLLRRGLARLAQVMGRGRKPRGGTVMTSPTGPFGQQSEGSSGDPSSLDKYELREVLGSGGMGEVRLAFEKSSGLEVVIKFVRTDILGVNPGAVLERFTREARFLARVQHPNVVRIYGYGADGTRPFIIMERVRGGSIFGSDPDRPVAPKKAASYIRQAALGLHVAHKYRIIHRDIKPDNLMVECDGTVKVIDFGLAKPLGADQTLTLEGQAIGTPAYMAPEQIASPDRIDARTDVYGLGATLYRLITGVKPFLGGHIGSVFSAIQKRDPLRPRIRNPSVDRDLEAICLKCLHKEPYRRYQSAHELAEDLGNYLDGRPVSARLTRAPERFIYWCRRNPAKAVLYTAIVLLIATVLATTYWSLTARAEAETARAVSGSMNDFWLNRILGQADPEHNPADARITVREALDRASEQLNSDQYSAPHPVVLAELHGAVGEVYRSVGVHDRAEIHIQKSLDLHSSLNGPNQPGALTARHNLAALYIDMGRAAEAEQLYRGVLAVRQSKLGRDHTDTLLTIDQLALALERQQDPTKFDEAERLLRQNLEDRTKLQGRGHEDTLDTMLALANLLIKRQKWGEAEPFLTECHTEMRLVRGPKHPRCVAATNSLIELLRHQGKKDEMVRMSAQNLGDAVAAYGKEHPQALVHRHSHAEKLFDAGSIKESEAMLRETLELQTRPGASTDPNDLALTRHSLGRVLLESGKPVEAEPLLREALKQRLASSPRNWVTGNTQFYLGRCLVKLKRYAEAERELIQAHEILQSSEGVPPKRRRMVVEELIELYSAWGRQDVAEEWKKRLLPSD